MSTSDDKTVLENQNVSVDIGGRLVHTSVSLPNSACLQKYKNTMHS
jgi:hypothetical protein